MSDLSRKLHNLKAADFKPEYSTIKGVTTVSVNAHGRHLTWKFKNGKAIRN